ncbi:MAG: metal ABC transporter permease [Deltaproteobacteria bacterium]|nr:metal ABC transporter permease [Deltaproteobacteria bacterium]MCL4873765.1 metal ABC transporter permease [bacterium]
MEALSILLFPFLACVLLVIAHAYFGVHVLRRGIIFVDLSLAQFIGLGIALSFFLGWGEWSGAAFSLGFAVLGAFILSFSRTISRLADIEAFIGVLYIFSLSASMLVLDGTPHGMEEFKAILNGSILWVAPGELFATFALYSGIGLFQFAFRRKFLSLSFEGRGGGAWEFLFFLSFALVLVKSVQMAGVLQVFAFLVIPVLIGKLLTDRLRWQLVLGWALGVGASLSGLLLSYHFDLPAAPLIVASLGILFFALLALRLFTGAGGDKAFSP